MVYETDPITNYLTLLEKVITYLQKKDTKKRSYYNLLDMSRITFDKRLKEKSFSPSELLTIIEYINKTFE